ncbi:DUF2017 family protein [Microbacterium sp.]|uniref:DUF2017 family protein n=1 Tax=Microbacterium sp. TaxID=51671 RepID=UPI003A958DFE
MTPVEIRMPLAMIEIVNLADLVDQLTEVITATHSDRDPAVARLTPNPYPEDAEASVEFTMATRDDLLNRRTADAALVRGALDPFLDPADERDERSEVELVVSAHEIDAWLRTLTALRLIIASRLRITDDSDLEDADDPRFNVFHWLGFRLDTMIALADEHEESPDGRAATEE